MARTHLLAKFAPVTLAAMLIANETSASVKFDKQRFDDLGDFVTVEGSPIGDGSDPETSRYVVWCYQERRECSAIVLLGSGDFVSILTPLPFVYTISLWAPDRIVAERHLVCGEHDTWRIDRLSKTAELFSGTCDPKIGPAGHITLGDPPSFKKA